MLFQVGFRHHSAFQVFSAFPLFRLLFPPLEILQHLNNAPTRSTTHRRKMSQKVLKRYSRFGTALAKASDVIDAREEPVPIQTPPSEVSLAPSPYLRHTS